MGISIQIKTLPNLFTLKKRKEKNPSINDNDKLNARLNSPMLK